MSYVPTVHLFTIVNLNILRVWYLLRTLGTMVRLAVLEFHKLVWMGVVHTLDFTVRLAVLGVL